MKKRLLGIATLATTSLALLTPMMSQTAMAATATPTQEGSVVLKTPANLDNNAITPFTVVNVGGGQWNYGSSHSLIHWSNTVWSDYYHPTLYHSSTASIGSQNNTSDAVAGSWSYASAVGGFTQTGYSYWSTY